MTLVVAGACAPDVDVVSPEPPALASPAFDDGGDIPIAHTCDGEDRPPPLAWEGTHPDAVELVLVVTDHDAPGGVFTHWLVAGVPPTDAQLDGPLPPGAVEGVNGFGRVGWAGPCPPPGDDAHTYRFEVIGISGTTGLRDGFTADDLDAAIEGHDLSAAVLEGRYQRR